MRGMNRQTGPRSALRCLTPERLVETGQRVAFWAAVVLSLVYVPMLYALSGETKGIVVGAVLTLHAACLVVGHDYTHRQENTGQ